MTFRLLGLTDEQRLAIEQETGIKTEGVKLLFEAANEQAQQITEQLIATAIKDVQSVVGPHGSVTRLQAGGVNISQGLGIGVFESGVLKTTIEPDGDLLVGSDITQPSTTSFCVFVNEQVYNGETMGAGDLLIGDNSTSTANVKYDTSEGQLQFRAGTTVQVYIDTDGSLKAGGGAVTLDVNGISIDVGIADINQLKFGDDAYINATGLGALDIVNSLTADEASIDILATGGSQNAEIRLTADPAGVSSVELLADEVFIKTEGGIALVEANLATGLVTVSGNSSLNGTLVVNESGADKDTRIEGDTDANLIFVDASTDRVGIGTGTPGHKLDVNGDVNISTGSVYRINGTTVISTAFAPREKLSADRTYYVRTDGSDSNNGLANTAGGAFLTWQKAYDTTLTIDLNSYTVTIQVADGTYTGRLNITEPPVGGNVTINGNASTPANVVLSVTSNDAIILDAPFILTVQNFKISTTTSGNCATVNNGKLVVGVGMDFGSCAAEHLRALGAGVVENTANNYTISGGGTRHYSALVGGKIILASSTITVSGTPAFSSEFVLASVGAVVSAFSLTFSGSATGTRYTASMNGVIQTYGGGANYFPGNAAGATSTGGQYG